MKTRYLFLFIFSGALFLSSCKPFYQCGQVKPKRQLFVSERVQTVLGERDSLCSLADQRENEINSLNKTIAGLNGDVAGLYLSLKEQEKKYQDLTDEYQDLTDEKLSQSASFNLALQQKSDELSAKEKLILEREAALKELQQVISRQDSVTNRLNNILRDALLSFKSDELSVEIKNGKVYVSMSDKLLFKSGSAAIETKGKEAIKVLADVLDKNRDISILVEGHTDSIPIRTAVYRDNWDLSVARATSIVRILTEEYKITPIRLTASGKGEFSPRDTNTTPEGRARNRRTEIILSPKLDEIMQLLKTN
ncbi:flagellar motor protein MotB [Mangrovibacterium sp.]|uniref:OmpA/MotB family protein n=1 Tax=Mangrovibacterium sp. TaxID=1961364 RepID=UPI00356724F5